MIAMLTKKWKEVIIEVLKLIKISSIENKELKVWDMSNIILQNYQNQNSS